MCQELVRNNRNDSRNIAIQAKLEGFKMVLAEWGRDLIRDFNERINRCRAILKRLRKGRDEVSLHQYKEMQKTLAELQSKEDILAEKINIVMA